MLKTQNYMLIFFVILFQGCSNIAMNPSINNIDTIYFNQLNHTSSLIIIDHELQQYIHTSGPTEGKLWKARTFEINLGKPLTDAVYQQVKALIPSAKIGHKPSTEKYDIIVILKMKNLDFGVIDDGGAQTKMLFGAIGAAIAAGDETVSHAKITISTELQISGKSPKFIDIIGEGIYLTGYYSTNEKAFTKAIENAISDFARKLTLRIEKELNEQVQRS